MPVMEAYITIMLVGVFVLFYTASKLLKSFLPQKEKPKEAKPRHYTVTTTTYASSRRHEENIKMFLEAEACLVQNDFDRYMRLKDRALTMAKGLTRAD